MFASSFVRDRQTDLLQENKAHGSQTMQGRPGSSDDPGNTKDHAPHRPRKLYYLLADQLGKLKTGRDKFFDILRANHLLIQPKRSYHVTTNSHHRFRKHHNLILEMPKIRPQQVWVSDITYIGKQEKPC